MNRNKIKQLLEEKKTKYRNDIDNIFLNRYELLNLPSIYNWITIDIKKQYNEDMQSNNHNLNKNWLFYSKVFDEPMYVMLFINEFKKRSTRFIYSNNLNNKYPLNVLNEICYLFIKECGLKLNNLNYLHCEVELLCNPFLWWFRVVYKPKIKIIINYRLH